MSNLVKAIVASDTGDRVFIKKKCSKLFQNVFDIQEDYGTTYVPEIAKLYKIGVHIGATCAVPERLSAAEQDVYGAAIKRTKEQVIEAIFGEFRQDFRLVEQHLYNYDFEAAADALRNMEKKMFTAE